MIIESFFQLQRDCKEDISTHVAKLQKLFVDLDDELKKHSGNTLSKRILTERNMPTLGKEYDIIKDVWYAIPTSKQAVNLLIEKLCAIELRADKLASAKATAFIAHDNGKNKSNFTKVSSSKSTKREADHAKQKFPYKYKQLC
jgi:hypothetical protein